MIQRFMFNDTATTESVVRLAAGEHEVELRVTDGGRTEIITKYIKVE